MAQSKLLSPEQLVALQRATFDYFWGGTNPDNGLIPDNTSGPVPASIAGVGLGLAACVVGADRAFVSRADAASRVLATLRFFWASPQGDEPDATGYRGFYYHFLELETGRRAWRCELSTMDTAILLAGALTAAAYFDGEPPAEREIRELAQGMAGRVDWNWARNGELTVTQGWTPERGFLKTRWTGYNEAVLLYILGLGSPSHPLPPESYSAWAASYRWKRIFDLELLYAGPLFIHQLPHLWVDFRAIRDATMREKRIDYFENSRRATYVQRQYAIRNPRRFRGYNENCWGLTATSGPGPATRRVDGVRRRFFGYMARGAPFGPDDGTLAPWATVASLPFAPEIVLPALAHYYEEYPEMVTARGLTCSFNPTFPDASARRGWVADGHYSLDQGPVILMIENYRSGLIWRLTRSSPAFVTGLLRAGFGGGWLEGRSG